ncbi:MAG TPA: magnesium/cobalt transporter CorA [Planctomycetota bacterium]|nr:magnesium/cobalt transporter CorA [Planctomycetota bacterium]
MIRALYAPKDGAPRRVDDRAEIERLFKAREGCLWVDLEAPTKDEQAILTSVCGLHELAVEQCAGHAAHPRLADFGGYVYVVVHAVGSVLPLKSTEIDVFLTPHALVTYREEPVGLVEDLRRRAEAVPALMGRGPDRLLAELLDLLAEEYLERAELLDTALDQVEDKLFKQAGRPALRDIFHLKKDILGFRRRVGPLREILHRLSRGDIPSVTDEERVLFRDVHDRVYRVTEMLETFRDVLAGAMEVYLTMLSHRTNEIVRVLTVFSIILMSTSLIAGIYGMNVEGLPMAGHPLGFWGLVAVMVGLGVGLLAYFRHRRWI